MKNVFVIMHLTVHNHLMCAFELQLKLIEIDTDTHTYIHVCTSSCMNTYVCVCVIVSNIECVPTSELNCEKMYSDTSEALIAHTNYKRTCFQPKVFPIFRRDSPSICCSLTNLDKISYLIIYLNKIK